MSLSKRYAKKQAKARQRRRLQAHERLARDRRQAQRTAEAAKEGGFLGLGGVRVSDAEQATLAEIARVLGVAT